MIFLSSRFIILDLIRFLSFHFKIIIYKEVAFNLGLQIKQCKNKRVLIWSILGFENNYYLTIVEFLINLKIYWVNKNLERFG